MDWKQLKEPNLNITYTGGWCLQAVEDAFGATHVDPSAIDDWTAEGKADHPGEQPPAGVYVPVFFSLGSVDAGHIAISLPDGRVASSTQPGVHTGLQIHPSLADMVSLYAQYNNGCTYLGWSEGVGGLTVVAPNNNQGVFDMTSTEVVKGLYRVMGDGFVPSDDVIAAKAGIIEANGTLDQVASDIRNSIPWIQQRVADQQKSDALKSAQDQIQLAEQDAKDAHSSAANLQTQLSQAQNDLKTCQQAIDPTSQLDCKEAVNQALSTAIDGYENNPFPLVAAWIGKKLGTNKKGTN